MVVPAPNAHQELAVWFFRPSANYPWFHGGPDNALTLTVEAACPKGLTVTVTPDMLRPRIPGESFTIPAPIRLLPTEATLKAIVKTCPSQSGSPPPSVEVSFEVKAPTASSAEAGGHAHDGTRPVGTLRDLGTGEEVTRCVVDTFDAEGMGLCTLPVPYQAPEISGFETIVGSAPGFPNAEAKVRVEVPGLVELAEDPTKYVRVGTPNNHAGTNDPCTPQANAPTSRHFDSLYGLPKLKEAVEQIAATMLRETGIFLRVNDMSLPKGGLFDFNNNWRTPHITHRVGRHADIGFEGIRGGICTPYNLSRLKEAILEVTKFSPLSEPGHFHASVP